MLCQFYNRVVSKSHVFIKACHTGPQRDPFALFFQKDVQEMLKVLTRLDLQKVFRPRMDGTSVEPPVYQFMTDEELEKSRADALKRAEKLLQMPPVVNVRKEIDEVLSVDPALQGYDDCKYVFTDITYGIKNEDRVIAVRETDGTLRSAKWDERSRLNEIYFPLPGRQMLTPKMFEGEFLQNLLDQQKYEFILDRACVQFEPDDPLYHNVTKAVYDSVNHNNHFEHLRSTRHFGPMVFHFVCNKEIDNLLLDNINTGHIEEAVTLIQLYHKVHPTAKSAGISPNDKQDLKFVENYALLDSPIKIRIQRAIRTFEELQNIKREANKGMERSHKLEASANAI